MRSLFFETLAEIGRADERVLLLTADLGFRAVECFADACPKQFFNTGVSEQNMIGMATGLAETGYFPFAYSITPFAVLRPFEFIRNGPVAHRMPVRVVGIGAGFDYGTNGISHYALEDIGVLRTQPGLTLIAPADKVQAGAALRATWAEPRPLYFRLSKDESAVISGAHGFALGQTRTLRAGADVLLLALGTAALDALRCADVLSGKGVAAHVELVDNLNGGPLESLERLLPRFRVAAVMESHYVNGGLGSLVCEMAAENGVHCRVIRCGVRELPDGISGSTGYMNARHGISAEAVAGRVLAALG